MYVTESGEIMMSIREAAREIGVVPATIRNWEKRGIIISKRIENGYRVFDHGDVTMMRGLKRYSRENKMSVNAASMIMSRSVPQNIPVPGEETGQESGMGVLKSEKWKQCRLERGFVLEDVARAVQISPSYLHKIENKQTNVSLDILQRLADFYGEDLLYYIADARSDQHIVRKGGGEPIDIGLKGVSEKSLIAMSKFSISAVLFTADPESGRPNFHSHHGEEFLHVLSGKIHFTLLNTEYVLSAGDSLSFRSTDTHSWFNHEKKEAQILWIYTPSTHP
ncbi:MerR family transcriptional regulator [Spirochaetia bacterium]|nr:MerR family transcriptional regulator [Spirochaetia bacterium]